MITFLGKFLATIGLGISALFGHHQVPVATSTPPVVVQPVATTTGTPATSTPLSLVKVTVQVKKPASTVSTVTVPVSTPAVVTPVAPAGIIACGGSFYKTQLACPSGKELVCSGSAPICQWTASSSAAIATQQAYDARQEASAQAAAQAQAAAFAQGKILQTEGYVRSDETDMQTACSPANETVSECESDLTKIGIDAQQEFLIGIPSQDKTSQLSLLEAEYVTIQNQVASMSTSGLSRAGVSQVEFVQDSVPQELKLLTADETLFK